MNHKKITIIERNDHFIFLDKAHGQLTTPARFSHDERLSLGVLLQQEIGRQIYPVHRLDFEVSGVVMFALNEKAHSVSNQWFEKKLVVKQYEAVSSLPVDFSLELGSQFEWSAHIVRGKKRSFIAPHGKKSETTAKLVNRSKKYAHWTLSPITGRPHQLRVELSRHGFPILGDILYGGEKLDQENMILLRSLSLDFRNIEHQFLENLPRIIKLESSLFNLFL